MEVKQKSSASPAAADSARDGTSRRTALLNGIGKSAERVAHVGIADEVRHGAPRSRGFEQARAREELKVARDHGEINGAALGHLPH